MIPIYLIVLGAFGIFRHFLGMHSQCKKRQDGAEQDSDEAYKKTFLERLVDCFLIAWFIAGNVWIYRIYEPSYDKLSFPTDYCDQTLYLFSFWLMNASYIFVGLFCCCMCCMLCCDLNNSCLLDFLKFLEVFFYKNKYISRRLQRLNG